MVARGERDDAAAAFLGREGRHGVVGAPELERARALQILALKEDSGAGAFVGRPGRHDGRAVGDAVQPGRGGLDIGIGRERDDGLTVLR